MSKLFLQKHKSTIHFSKALPILVGVLAVTGIIFWLYLVYWQLFIFKMPKDTPFLGLVLTSNILRRLAYLTISVSGIYILFKATYTRAGLYFTLLVTYLSAYSAFVWLIRNGILTQNWWVTTGGLDTVLGIMVVRTFQEFPGNLTSGNLKLALRPYPMKVVVPVLRWLLAKYRTGLVFLLLGLANYYLIPAYDAYSIIYIFFGLAYLFAQLRVQNIASKRPLYWLLWVVSLFLFQGLLFLFALLFGFQITGLIYGLVDVPLSLSLMFAFVMIVFFSDLLDAKLIFQKTVIIGTIIFLFTFVFGVFEHFVIHKLSHYFQIEGVYVSSTFACIIGMCFQPLKKKLTHWMKHFDYKTEHEQI